MKLLKLIGSANMPRRKCGAVAAGIFGGLGLLDLIAQSETNYSNQAFAAQQNLANRIFQSMENTKQRDWAERFWREQFDESAKEWYSQQTKQFSDDWQMYRLQSGLQQNYWQQQQDYAQDIWMQQQEYMSPQNMLARLNAAGLNGAAIYNGQQGASMGLSSAPVTSPSGNVGSHQPVVPPTPSTAMAASGGTAMAQALNPMAALVDSLTSLSEAAENSVHSKEMWSLIEPKIMDYLSKSGQQEALAKSIQLDSQLKESTMPAKIKKAWADVLTETAHQEMLFALAGKYDEEKVNAIADRARIISETANLDQQSQLLIQQVAWYPKEAAERIKTMKAQQENYKAVTAYNLSLSKTEDALRSGRVKAQDLANQLQSLAVDMAKIDRSIAVATKEDKISVLVAQAEQQGLITRQMAAQASKMETEADYAGLQAFLGCLGQAVGMYTGLRGVSISEFSAEQKVDIQREFNRLYGEDVRLRGSSNSQSSYKPEWQKERERQDMERDLQRERDRSEAVTYEEYQEMKRQGLVD